MANTALNRFIFSYKLVATRLVKSFSLLASLTSLILLATYYGYEQSEANDRLFLLGFQSIFAVYILSFLIRVLFTLKRAEFLRANWFEGLLMLLLIYDLVSLYMFDVPILHALFMRLGFSNITLIYFSFIQLYILVFAGIDVVKLSQYLSRLKIRTPAVFGMSFILLITLGAFLLQLPEMTTIQGSMPLMDAFFTSVSASCVTGLSVVDCATYFTFKGQFVLLILFQIGGIGIITFALFFALFLRSGAGIQSQNTVKEMLDTANLVAARTLLKQVVMLTIIIEGIGATLIYIQLEDVAHGSQRIFFAIFHSVSAFCNAGFSLFTDGLYNSTIRENFFLHLTIAAIIFLGSLGFPTIHDIFGFKAMRKRMAQSWRDWTLSTKISLYTSIVLVVAGSFLFFGLEQNYSLAGTSKLGQISHAIFQSVSTRTAGFNTVDFSTISQASLIMMIFFMFIGASSASTGGGIKTSTFVVLFLSVFATIRNRKNIEIGKRRLPADLLNKALTIFLFAAIYIFVAVFLLSISETKMTALELLFETVSAFCTVGLSTGITADFSPFGKVILMVSMYMGRVGILTLVVALSSNASPRNYKYPTARPMIG